MFYEKPEHSENGSDIPAKKVINDPFVVPILFHKKKQIILYLLIKKELNIMDLKNETKWNPGTIKRYLDDLVSKDLVRLTRKLQNEYGFFLKYYRATAKSFVIHIEWPSDILV